MNEFFARLKQRKLVQWALAYVAAAFALIQVVDVVAHHFGCPEVLQRGITLLLAWYHGEQGRQRVSGTELLLIALVLAVGGGLLWHFGRAGSKVATTVPASAGVIASRSPDGAQRNPGMAAPDSADAAATSGLRAAA